MTVTDLRTSNSIEFDVENRPALGEIAPGEPVYMIPVNEWLPWANRAAGFAIGTWAAALVTLFLTPHLVSWAIAAGIATTLLFAWVMAGHELRERNPKTFKRAE